MISVVILTYNEITNIERCLASVSWSDDVVIVDSGSTDGTCELAEKLGARIIYREFDNFANQRNFALDNAGLKYGWVLHIDADEVASPELRRNILHILESDENKLGYHVPSKLIFLGQWLKYSGMYPSYQVRFGRKESLRFHMVGHGQRETLDGHDVGVFEGFLVHHNFSKGISDWLVKHARYSIDEANLAVNNTNSVKWNDLLTLANKTQRRRTLKKISALIPMRPLVRFIYIYFLKFGFLDGRAGIRYAVLIAFYQWFIDLNIAEIKLSVKGDKFEK